MGTALLAMTKAAAERATLPNLRSTLDQCRRVTEFPSQHPRGYDDATMAAETAEVMQWLIWRTTDARMDASELKANISQVHRHYRALRRRTLARDLLCVIVGLGVGYAIATAVALAVTR